MAAAAARLWPGGPAGRNPLYEVAGSAQVRLRARRYRAFEQLVRPTPDLRVLDVGVTNSTDRGSNFLEVHYPWPERITAVSADPNISVFHEAWPQVDVVLADGRDLPFEDRAFDVAFSNAVLEHVGSRVSQARFVAELCRVADRVFVSTPNPAFPLETHTLLPLVHWLPPQAAGRVLRATGRGYWADPTHLHLVPADALRAMFPSTHDVHEPMRPVVRALSPVTTFWAVRR